MKPKLITVLVVAVIVAAGLWLTSEDKNQDAVDYPNTKLAGEVALSLPDGPKQKALQSDQVPPDFYIIKENQTQDNQVEQPDQQISTLSELKGKYVFINFLEHLVPALPGRDA